MSDPQLELHARRKEHAETGSGPSTTLLPALEQVLGAWEAKARKGLGTMMNDANTARDHAEEVRRALASDLSGMRILPADWHMVPDEPTDAILRPFYDCPPEELVLAYKAMLWIAALQHKQTAAGKGKG